MKAWLRIVCVAVLILLLNAPGSARADVAPPSHPPGSNPQPGAELTQVRMLAETVLLDVQASTPQNSLGQARVSADFTMQNLGTAAENMKVRFPLGSNNGFGEILEIEDVIVKVNGSLVPTHRVMQADPVWGGDPVPWVEFDVTFPPQQDVAIEVTYLLEATGEYPFVSFDYIFHTGAGWRDTIGSVDLIVRLPYEANIQNVIFGESTGWSSTTLGGLNQGQEIRWHFDNLEPDQRNDFEISLIMPSAWQKVLKEKSNTDTNPNDGEAWGRLGKLYKEMFFFRRSFRHDVGGQEVYRLSLEAYEKAVTLLPDDALWHAGFADVLAVHSYYGMQEGQDLRDEILRSMKEILLAQELAPNDPKVGEIAEKIYFLFPEAIQKLESGYDYLWLTVTPEPVTETLAPMDATSTPPATDMLPATAAAVTATDVPPDPTPVPATKPLCVSAFIIPFAVVWLIRSKKALRA